METLTGLMLLVSKVLLPLLALWLLLRCVRSMLRERYEPELWARLEFADDVTAYVSHWESIIGSGKRCRGYLGIEILNRPYAG